MSSTDARRAAIGTTVTPSSSLPFDFMANMTEATTVVVDKNIGLLAATAAQATDVAERAWWKQSVENVAPDKGKQDPPPEDAQMQDRPLSDKDKAAMPAEQS